MDSEILKQLIEVGKTKNVSYCIGPVHNRRLGDESVQMQEINSKNTQQTNLLF